MRNGAGSGANFRPDLVCSICNKYSELGKSFPKNLLIVFKMINLTHLNYEISIFITTLQLARINLDVISKYIINKTYFYIGPAMYGIRIRGKSWIRIRTGSKKSDPSHP